MNKAFVIAEIGINHNGNFNLAKKLISSAAKTGADAVKFQTYITEKRVDKNSPIFDILKKCELSFSQFSKLKKFSESKKIEFMSTPLMKKVLIFLSKKRLKKLKLHHLIQ